MAEDNNGYSRGNPEHSDLISRQIAFKEIYQKHRERYPLPFSKYVVHHRDREKHNNSIKNLDVVTPEEHKAIHKLRLAGKKELDNYETEQYTDESDKYVSLEELNRIKKENLADWEKRKKQRGVYSANDWTKKYPPKKKSKKWIYWIILSICIIFILVGVIIRNYSSQDSVPINNVPKVPPKPSPYTYENFPDNETTLLCSSICQGKFVMKQYYSGRLFLNCVVNSSYSCYVDVNNQTRHPILQEEHIKMWVDYQKQYDPTYSGTMKFNCVESGAEPCSITIP